MATNYEMWLTSNGEAKKLLIPVLPEQFTASVGSKNNTVDVVGLGEIIVKQARPAFQFTFSSFFPAAYFPGMRSRSIKKPLTYVNEIKKLIESTKPVHLIITSLGVDSFCTIEKFSWNEQGGDVGTIYYDMTLKEYREITVRQVKVGASKTASSNKSTATVKKTETRVDNTQKPKTHTVVYGDCLWNIAKKYYGDGAKYTVIYNANKKIIGSNPNVIKVGQVLTIPSI